MKKPVMLLLTAALCLGLTGCADGQPPERAADGSGWDEGWVTVGGVVSRVRMEMERTSSE